MNPNLDWTLTDAEGNPAYRDRFHRYAVRQIFRHDGWRDDAEARAERRQERAPKGKHGRRRTSAERRRRFREHLQLARRLFSVDSADYDYAATQACASANRERLRSTWKLWRTFYGQPHEPGTRWVRR